MLAPSVVQQQKRRQSFASVQRSVHVEQRTRRGFVKNCVTLDLVIDFNFK